MGLTFWPVNWIVVITVCDEVSTIETVPPFSPPRHTPSNCQEKR